MVNPPPCFSKLIHSVLSFISQVTTGNKHAIGRGARIIRECPAILSDVGTVGLGRSELVAISVEVMPLGENAHTALTSWGLTAGKGREGGVYFPRTPYLVRGEWTKDFTGVGWVFDGLWYPGVG